MTGKPLLSLSILLCFAEASELANAGMRCNSHVLGRQLHIGSFVHDTGLWKQLLETRHIRRTLRLELNAMALLWQEHTHHIKSWTLITLSC